MKRIFIISRHPLFGEGIEELLHQQSGAIVLGREQDMAKAIQQIFELQPDIVIFDCNDEQIDISSAVMQILQKGVNTRVIGLDLNENMIYTHTREQQVVKEIDDLLKAVE